MTPMPRAEHHRADRHLERDARAIDDAAVHVAAHEVGAEPVRSQPGFASESAALVDSGSYIVMYGAKAAANTNITIITAPAAPSG